MNVYINGASSGMHINGVKANASSFTFDLKLISGKLSDGKNTLVFHPDDNVFDYAEFLILFIMN